MCKNNTRAHASKVLYTLFCLSSQNPEVLKYERKEPSSFQQKDAEEHFSLRFWIHLLNKCKRRRKNSAFFAVHSWANQNVHYGNVSSLVRESLQSYKRAFLKTIRIYLGLPLLSDHSPLFWVLEDQEANRSPDLLATISDSSYHVAPSILKFCTFINLYIYI